MRRYTIRVGQNEYVIDVLLPDLAGHDRAPNAFLVYVVLWAALFREEQRTIAGILSADPRVARARREARAVTLPTVPTKWIAQSSRGRDWPPAF